VRRVTLTAKGTLGMLINPMTWPIVDDVTQQARRAQVSDRTERGEFTGIRQESRSYVFERAGQYQLPAQDVHWWDAENQRLVTSTLAAHTVTVLPSALAVSDEHNSVEKSTLPKGWLKTLAALLATVLVTALVTIAIGYFVLKITRRLMGIRRKFLQAYKNSQGYARRQLLRACKRGDKTLILRRFYRWQQRLPAGVLETQQGAELQAAFTEFYQMYYRPSDDSAAAEQRLAARVQGVARQASRFKLVKPRGRALVDLNPR